MRELVVVRVRAATARGGTFRKRLRLAEAESSMPVPPSVRVAVNVFPVAM
jgi:hypothetical protein